MSCWAAVARGCWGREAWQRSLQLPCEGPDRPSLALLQDLLLRVPGFISSFHSNLLRNGRLCSCFLARNLLILKVLRRHGEEQTQPHVG